MTDFRIRVIIDPTPAKAGAKQVEGQLKRTKGASDRLRSSLLRTFGGLGLAVGVAGSIRLLADYSQAMSTVQAVTGATAEEFDRLNERAQDLGRNTRFTATQAAEGMVLLARAGFTAEESLVAVEGTLKLAQAGGLGLAEAANITANSLRGFRLEVEDTGRVVDVLALAANSANTNVQQLGDGLKFVAPIAAGLGLSIETTTAAVSKLSDSGLQATLAGTGLRRVLSELESPSQKTAEILRDLGVSTDDVRVSQVGLVNALQALKDAGIDTGQALEIFGDRGGPAFEVLSSNIPAVEKLAEKLEGAAGTADRVAEVMDDNLNGALLRALSAFQGLVLAFGDVGGFNLLTGAANGLAASFNFLTDNVEGLTAALTVLGVGLLLTRTAIVANAAVGAGAVASYVAQTVAATALTFALGGFTAVASGALVALKGLAVASIANPFALVAAGAGFAFVAVGKLTRAITEYEEALKQAEGGELSALSDFGKLGAQIAKAEERLREYEDRFDNLDDNPALLAQITKLRDRIAELKDEQDKIAGSTDKAREAAAALAEAQEKVNAGLLRSVQGLKDEARLLQLDSREREIQAALLLNGVDLLQEGGPELINKQINKQIEELEVAIRRNAVLREEADALDSIRGPQEEFIARLDTLTRLQDQGRITAEEFDEAVRSLAEANSDLDLENLRLPEGLADDVDLSGQIEQIRALIEAEQDRAQAEAARASLLRDILGPEKELQEQIVILNGLLEEGAITNEQYALKLAEINEQLNPLTEEQKRLAEVLESIKGPEEERAQRMADLNALLAMGTITLSEYNAEMEKLQTREQELGTSFGDGISSGLEKIGNQMRDIGSLTESALVNAFNSAEDALTEFITTGKFNFGDFARSIIADITKIVARLLILKAVEAGLNAFGGGAGSAASAASSGVSGFASGGDFEANQSMIVGENGPELVRFGAPGNVTPAGQTAQAMAATGNGGGQGATQVNVAPAEVKLQVVNVSSEEEARSAMDTTEGGKIIMNQLRTNKNAVKRELGIR